MGGCFTQKTFPDTFAVCDWQKGWFDFAVPRRLSFFRGTRACAKDQGKGKTRFVLVTSSRSPFLRSLADRVVLIETSEEEAAFEFDLLQARA